MKTKRIFICLWIVLLLTGILMSQCKKNSSPDPLLEEEPDPTEDQQSNHSIYVLGQISKPPMSINTGVLWKDGKIIFQSDGTKPTYFNDFAILNNTIYIVGYEVKSSGKKQSMLWVNGIANPFYASNHYTTALNITLHQQEPYVLIYEEKSAGLGSLILWNKGATRALTNIDQPFQGQGLAIHQEQVYAVGIRRDSPSVGKAFSFIQQQIYYLPTQNQIHSSATDVLSIGGHVYVSGVERMPNQFLRALYWKNGQMTYASDGAFNAYVNSIWVDKGDGLVGGYVTTSPNNITSATVWRNQQPIYLSDHHTNCSVLDFAIYLNDLYAVGYKYVDGKGMQPHMWKNQTSQTLEGSAYTGSFNKIIIQ
jgi:hypothetical protein